MEKYLVQHASQHISVTLLAQGCLHSLRDRASEASCSSGILCQNFPSHFCGIRRRRRDFCAIGTHYLSPEGLLLIGYLHHVNLAVQPQVSAGHRQSGSPLAGSRLGGHTFQPLIFRIVSLGNG